MLGFQAAPVTGDTDFCGEYVLSFMNVSESGEGLGIDRHRPMTCRLVKYVPGGGDPDPTCILYLAEDVHKGVSSTCTTHTAALG